MLKEIWKDIPGYENYYKISSLGRIKSVDRNIIHRRYNTPAKYAGKILKTSYRKPYSSVRISKGSTVKEVYIHKLMAQIFIPNPENKPQINHKNGNKFDNNLDNIEWCTLSEKWG